MLEYFKLKLLQYKRRKTQKLIYQLKQEARHKVRYVSWVDESKDGNAEASALLSIDGCVIARLKRPGQKSCGDYEILYENSGSVREHYIKEFYKKLIKEHGREF